MQIEASLSEADIEAIAQRLAAILLPQLRAQAAIEPADPLISEPRAAVELGVLPHCLRDARRRGLIECIRVGKFVRYSRQQIDDFRRRQTEAKG